MKKIFYHFSRSICRCMPFTSAFILFVFLSYSASANILINEIDVDQSGTDTAEFVELYNAGSVAVDISDYQLVFYDGYDQTAYEVYSLSSSSLDVGGYHVLCGDDNNVTHCDQVVSPTQELLQDGADAVALYSSSTVIVGDPVSVIDLVDAIVYDTNDIDNSELLVLLNSGEPQVNESERSDSTLHSNQRFPNGSGGTRNTVTYTQLPPTPGELNVSECVSEPDSCDDGNPNTNDICFPESGCINLCSATSSSDPKCSDPACSATLVCNPTSLVRTVGDVNANGTIGLEETIYSLQVTAGQSPIFTPSTFITPVYFMTFNLIPAGMFIMGSPDDEADRDLDEGPQVETTISQPFYMMISEVSQWQWQAVVLAAESSGDIGVDVLDDAPSYYKESGGTVKANHPVEQVNYENIQTWIELLNTLEGRVSCDGLDIHAACYRLPTEAEWEYAARAGTTKAYANPYNYDLTDPPETGGGFNPNIATMGWYEWNDSNGGYPTGTKPLMRKQANSWGLYDMHGNVWEWCRDWYEYDYYSLSERPAIDPEGVASGLQRVIRGGSWWDGAGSARLAYRWVESPSISYDELGFRLVLPSSL